MASPGEKEVIIRQSVMGKCYEWVESKELERLNILI